jgi:acyl-coenzyme A synthetase/AMP-(fatty) acid ligase
MPPDEASARAGMRASLLGDPGRVLVRARERTWTAGEILGAAEVLRPLFLAGESPLGLAFRQPGWMLAALLASWGAGRRPLLFDPGLKREAEALGRLHPGIAIYTDADQADGHRTAVGQALAESLPLAAPPAWFRLPADDQPFASLLTSASTGDNKVIDKQGFQFYRQAEALASVLALPAGGCVLSFVPPFHLLGFFYGLVLPLAQGAETVVATELAGAPMLELLAKYGPDLVVGTATHYRFLVRAGSRAEVPRARTLFLSSGAPLDPTVAEAFAASFGTVVRDFYGSTELGGVAFRAWPDHYRAMRGVRWRIDEGSGALVVLSPWGGGEEGVWLATGDAAESAGDDGFRLLGRLDHVVKVGGKRFSTIEVEQSLRTMPGVAEAAVVTYQRFGEPALAAVIALYPKIMVEETAVRAFLAERLAAYKLPRSILMLPALPKGSHDKVDYRALRTLVAESLCASTQA